VCTLSAEMLYGRINRDAVSFTECAAIAEILGYTIEFKEKA